MLLTGICLRKFTIAKSVIGKDFNEYIYCKTENLCEGNLRVFVSYKTLQKYFLLAVGV